MNKQDIRNLVKVSISNVSNTTPEEIQDNDTISKYVPAVAKLALVSEIENNFSKVDITDLTNSLFDSITKVKDLVNYLVELYNGNDDTGQQHAN
jgi:hypothetical protein